MSTTLPGDAGLPPTGALRSWRDRAVIAAALASLMSGVGQFGAVAALGDVARAFGDVHHGASLADQAGLSGTKLGVGLAVIRLASLGGLPVAGLADRFGRRRVILTTVTAGLALTALTSASPGYWWFVALFAAGRPLLSATDAVAEVMAGEHTGSADRARAVALIAAGYGVGAGIIALVHSAGYGYLGFRGLFALVVVPLLLVPLLRRWTAEPNRFVAAAAGGDRPLPVFGAVGRRFRRRLLTVAVIAFAISILTGPANGFVFLYAQNVLHESGAVTAGMVVGAGLAGLAGLVTGQWMADHIGRRLTCTVGLSGMLACGVLTYSGSEWAMVTGYVAGVGAGSILAPAVGAMVNEIFPTAVRASVMGWWIAAGVLGAAVGLVVFGAVADVGDQFRAAAAVTFLPLTAATVLFWMVPESRGREPEQVPMPEQLRTPEQVPMPEQLRTHEQLPTPGKHPVPDRLPMPAPRSPEEADGSPGE